MNFLDELMAPLGREHCAIYYVFGLFSFFMAIVALIRAVFFFVDKKTSDLGMILLFNSLGLFLGYYIYRILYSICMRSLI